MAMWQYGICICNSQNLCAGLRTSWTLRCWWSALPDGKPGLKLDADADADVVVDDDIHDDADVVVDVDVVVVVDADDDADDE